MIKHVHGIYKIKDLKGSVPAGCQEDCTTSAYFDLVFEDDIEAGAQVLEVLYADNLNDTDISFEDLVFYKSMQCRFKTED